MLITATTAGSLPLASCATPYRKAASARELLTVRTSSEPPLTAISVRVDTGSTKRRMTAACRIPHTAKNIILSATVMAMKSGRFAREVASGMDCQSIA